MSNPKIGKETKLKSGIIENAVTPLLIHLQQAEKELQDSKHEDSEIGEIFQNIKKKVEETKDILKEMVNWEGELVHCFGMIERHIESWLENRNDVVVKTHSGNICCELITKMKKPVPTQQKNDEASIQSSQMFSNSPPENTEFVIGESSKTGSIPEEDTAVDLKAPNSHLRDCVGSLGAFLTKMKKLVPTQQKNDEVSIHSSQMFSNSPPENTEFVIGESSKTGSIPKEDTAVDWFKSMKELNPQLRDCVRSLGAFPQNSVLRRKLLIYWWIGLGIITSGDGKRAEEIGEIFFTDLVKQGLLIENSVRKHNEVVELCEIQPDIHKKLISASRKKPVYCGKSNEKNSVQFCTIRANGAAMKAVVNDGEKYLKSDDIGNAEKIDIHVAQIGQWKTGDNPYFIEECHIEVDKTDFMGDWGPNLTYLSLRNISGITELPECIGKLRNLIILDLRACHNLERLPKKFSSSKSLTHLDVSECYLLGYMPKWIGELSKLEVLKGFLIGGSGSKQKCKISDLSKLGNLRKLSIKIIHQSMISPEELKGLKSLDSLLILTIMWGVDEEKIENKKSDEENRGIDAGKMSEPNKQKALNIIPPKNLRKLDLRCFPRTEAPELLNPKLLKNVTRLYIRGGKLAKIEDNSNDPNDTWNVEILRLRFLKFFEMDWPKLGKLFKNIRCVEFESKECPTKNKIWKKTSNEPFPSGSDSQTEIYIT